jgi:uncharacterized protein YkwD
VTGRGASLAAAAAFATLGGTGATPSQAPDWDVIASGVVAEISALRENPAGYARHLELLLPRFDGRLLQRPGRPPLQTREGAAAVREAIEVLRRTPPMSSLSWSPGMAAAALDHVRDQGPWGGLEHDGRDGSSPGRRISRYGRWRGSVAESIAFGENPARDVVLQLVIDDDVADRGHRATLLDPKFAAAGAACGPHARYRQMCVVEFAVGFVEGKREGR